MTSLWHLLGGQLAHPTGWGGRLTGAFMRIVNRTPNRLAIAALDLQPDDDVLELGFGPGEAIAGMTRLVPHGSVTGIDLSEAMLRAASRRNRRAIRRGHVRLQQGDFSQLPCPDESFDKVVAINTAYFWHDAPPIIQGIRRVLRPGGRLVIYVTDAATMRGWKFARTDTHEHYDAGRLKSALVDGGFDAHDVRIEQHRLPGSVRGLIAIAGHSCEEAAPAQEKRNKVDRGVATAMRAACAALLAASAQPASAADLTVTLTGVYPGKGRLHVALYAGPDGFRHEDKALRRETADANGESATVQFRGLPRGRYAVMVYQDANGNGKLDLRFGMFPKEAWGLSNDPRVMGPPSFSASAFDIEDQDKAIRIPMHN